MTELNEELLTALDKTNRIFVLVNVNDDCEYQFRVTRKEARRVIINGGTKVEWAQLSNGTIFIGR